MKDTFGIVVVGVIIRVASDGTREILIGKKRSDSLKDLAGQWHIPAGRPFLTESYDQTALREMWEETGLELVSNGIITTTTWQKQNETGGKKHYWRLWFHLEPKPFSVKPKAGGDLEDVKWVLVTEIRNHLSKQALYPIPEEILKFIEGP